MNSNFFFFLSVLPTKSFLLPHFCLKCMKLRRRRPHSRTLFLMLFFATHPPSLPRAEPFFGLSSFTPVFSSFRFRDLRQVFLRYLAALDNPPWPYFLCFLLGNLSFFLPIFIVWVANLAEQMLIGRLPYLDSPLPSFLFFQFPFLRPAPSGLDGAPHRPRCCFPFFFKAC